MSILNNEFREKLIIRSMLTDPRFVSLVVTPFDERFFETQEAGKIFSAIKSHFLEFKTIPEKDIILNTTDQKNSSDILEYLNTLNQIDFDHSKNFDFLIKETDHWLKEAALKNAIMESVEIIEKNNHDEFAKISDKVKEALSKSIKQDLGLNYFDDMAERLKKMFTAAENRIPTYFPRLDEFFCGGLPPYTLTVGLAKIHAGKSNLMINIMSRQVMNGYNAVLFTLEMSDNATAQRLDSIYSGLDINRIYISKRKELLSELKRVKENEKRGNLYIKQFAPGTASILDFRAYLRELEIHGFKPDIVYCDYINLMKPSYKSKDSMYQDVKRITEELRALSFEFEIPVFSVSQLNREGMKISFDEVDFTNTSESVGVPATADALFILGTDPDRMVYTNEVHYKIVKNRIGGQIGAIDKFYLDPRSLKLYDSTELQLWMNDAQKSGCEDRPIFENKD